MSARVSFFVFCLISLILVVRLAAEDGGDRPNLFRGDHGIVTNVVPDLAKARQDTVYLMGGRDDWSGRFEDSEGEANWQGWTPTDVTQPTEIHWHVSDYYGEATGADPGPGNHVAYCGDESLPACDQFDVIGGYGNNWADFLEWLGTAPDPAASTTVALDYYISHHVEPNYDYAYFKVARGDAWETLRTYNNLADNVHEQFTFQMTPDDYVGPENDQIHLRIEFTSDGTFSDQDCLWPTHGAVQVDDIAVSLNGEVATFDDFEQREEVGNWTATVRSGTGNFWALRRNLMDLDPCVDNYSWQATYIDDGEVVPGTGGSECISWCYGPGGYIVNNDGGLLGPDFHINGIVYSPPLEWPEGDLEGATFEFEVYRHEELVNSSVSPGIFYMWNVRSVNTGNPDDLVEVAWHSRNFLYLGGPDYKTHREPVSDLLVPGRTHVQLSLQVIDFGWAFGFFGDDGTPAPYFDNVRLVAYGFEGPGMTAREVDLAQDTFPTRGSIDYGDLAVNHCRFDMARDVELDQGLVFGDSIIVSISPLRAGAELTGPPRLLYILETNPLFNAVRGSELGTPDAGGRITGFVEGDVATINGFPIEGRYAFDLPDEGHFFPGDRLRYIIAAEDAIDGISDPESATLPADTAGFSRFHDPMLWEMKAGARFAVNFLPNMMSATPGDQPKILFWNDFGGAGFQNEWYHALKQAGYDERWDYDTYYTNSPSSGSGNGLGGTATAELLAHYDILLYSSGTLSGSTITPADPINDEGDDVGVLSAWFEQGNKRAFFTGDNLATDLGFTAPGFLNSWMGIAAGVQSVRSYIDNQVTPLALAVDGNPIIGFVDSWRINGGCPQINQFDGVEPLAGAQVIAEFGNLYGEPGGYMFPAGIYFENDQLDHRSVFLPYDLAVIQEDQNADPSGPISTRSLLLHDVLIFFGALGGPAIDVPEALAFAARVYPNPFNPKTTISYTLPRASAVTVKVYDLRGSLVRTLLDETPQPAGPGSVVWGGENDQGGQVASGVYFYEVRAGEHRKVAKLTLVK